MHFSFFVFSGSILVIAIIWLNFFPIWQLHPPHHVLSFAERKKERERERKKERKRERKKEREKERK
jgi:hypothetical protein